MRKVSYSIGTNPLRKNNSTLYLWRTEKTTSHMVAKFMDHTSAALFANEFEFPLSDEVKRILSTAQVSGRSDTRTLDVG